MTALTWGLDLLFAGGAVALAAGALASRDLFRSVVLFIVFGLLVALIWARLSAPDLALAEAAIGAGLTGALFLVALSRFRSEERGRSGARERGEGERE